MKPRWRNTRTRTPDMNRNLLIKTVENDDAQVSYFVCERRGDRFWGGLCSYSIVSPYREIFWMYLDEIEEASRE